MTCAAAAAIAGAVSVMAGGDRIVLAPSDNAAALVCYHNGPNVSRQGDYALTLDGLTVHFRLDVRGDETLTVMPPAGYMVWPPEGAESAVQDGQSVTVKIIMGVS